MSTPATRNASAGVEEKPGFRTKTVATRITPEELREVENAAEREVNPWPSGSAIWR